MLQSPSFYSAVSFFLKVKSKYVENSFITMPFWNVHDKKKERAKAYSENFNFISVSFLCLNKE